MLLVVCATEIEAAAVAPAARESFAIGPYDARGGGALTCLVGGIGPAAAAAATATALALGPYDAVLCAGIAGGFGVPVGEVVVADAIVAADIGVEDGGWQSLAPPLVSGGARLLPGAVCGPVLTVSTITSTDTRAQQLRSRFPGAVAEAMEGYGIAWAAAGFGIPAYELRGISNAVGRRDRAAWDVPAALRALTAVMPTVIDRLEP